MMNHIKFHMGGIQSKWAGVLAIVLAVVCAGCQATADNTGDGAAGHERQVIYVSAEGDGVIEVFAVDSAAGTLERIQTVEVGESPGAMAVSADGTHLYASIRAERAVATLRIDPASGELTLLEREPIGTNAVYLATERSGRFLLSADYGGASVASHAIDEQQRVVGEPVQTRQTDENAHAIVLDDRERFAFVPHTGPSAIFQFRFDAETGELEPNDPAKLEVDGGAGPRHFRFHPKRDDRAYSVNELGSSVSVYAFDDEAGTLRELGRTSTLPDDFDGKNTCAEIRLTGDGRFVYASNRGHDSIAVYAVDEQDGGIALVERVATEPRPRSFTFDANDRFLYAAGKDSNRLAVYRVDRETGRLTRQATVETGSRPAWVQSVALD